MNDPSDPSAASGIFGGLHAVWLVVTGVGAFFLKRTFKQLDEKADKDAVAASQLALEAHKAETDRKFAAMQVSINNHIATQIQQHADNTNRLDNILLKLTERRD